MKNSDQEDLSLLEQRLGPEIWSRRLRDADEEAQQLSAALARVRAGESRRVALAAECPEGHYRTMLGRLRKFEEGGRDALIDRRLPVPKERKVTAEVKGAVRALARAYPEKGSEALVEELEAVLGVRLGHSTMRETLSELGLARGRGRPPGKVRPEEEVTPLPLAGAELLKAVEEEVGAVRHLTRALGSYLGSLPAPEGEVLDDRAHRDERGRFLPAYNEPKSRTEVDLGGKFDTVERRRCEKDLRAMRLSTSSEETRYRKDLALTLLPVLVDAPRWSVLGHWQGAWLESLVGHAYMPSTLDKHAREMKLAGVSGVAREATAEFWMEQDGLGVSGGLIVYVDATTKPLWTDHFTRCTKVSSTGRVMPGLSTVWLNSGTGTPLIYRTFSGHASVPREVSPFLRQVESAVGSGMTERLVVLDRESHAVWLFKELDEGGWQYIVPLRTSVTGPNAKFEALGEWLPYGTSGDETRDGRLWLRDSRAGESPLCVRVVARKRHRTGKVSWFATNSPIEDCSPSTTLDRYFDRWPLQEQVFRLGKGRVGLDVHHGYGKKRVTNVAVVSNAEKLTAQLERIEQKLDLATRERDSLQAQQADWEVAASSLDQLLGIVATEMDSRAQHHDLGSPEALECYAELRRCQKWNQEARECLPGLGEKLRLANDEITSLEARAATKRAELDRLAGRTTIYTVDTELDDIMTAYKLTFMNLAALLLRRHMGETMELDTLIRSVLTLPGERVVTKTAETIRIYRTPRDKRAMEAVERACASLNSLCLTRGPESSPRLLRFELVAAPTTTSTNGSGRSST